MKIPKGAKVKEKELEINEKIEEIEVLVNVTAADIRNGERGDNNTCAIAQSLIRQFDEEDVTVDSSESIEIDGFELISVSAPSKVQKFIDDFDEEDDEGEAKKKVKPFKFRLKLRSKEE